MSGGRGRKRMSILLTGKNKQKTAVQLKINTLEDFSRHFQSSTFKPLFLRYSNKLRLQIMIFFLASKNLKKGCD